MLLSLVIPVYNEQEVLPTLLQSLRHTLLRIHCDYEIIFVNDGSKDATKVLLDTYCAEDHRVKALNFCRNFGHQMAITAGMDFARGDAVVVMDADLQDPPEVLLEMVAAYRQGYDVVSAQRVARREDTWFKRNTAALFYWMMRTMVDDRLPPQVADFRLYSRAAITALGALREQHRFMRGMVAWLGLKEAFIQHERPARAAGSTKFSTLKMVRFAWTAITSFSGLPLRLALLTGALLLTIGVLTVALAIYQGLIQHAIPGWTSLLAANLTLSGATLVAIGVVGDYIARIYEEIKGRPLYVVNEALNIDVTPRNTPRAIVLPQQTVREEQWSVARR